MLLLLLSAPAIVLGEITDGFPTGRKIHMVGGANSEKPYAGFILNRNEAIEDQLVLRGDFSSAFKIYEKLDQRGDTTASHNLGLMYIRGLAVKKDLKVGMKYLEKAMRDLPNFATSNNYYEKAKREFEAVDKRSTVAKQAVASTKPKEIVGGLPPLKKTD